MSTKRRIIIKAISMLLCFSLVTTGVLQQTFPTNFTKAQAENSKEIQIVREMMEQRDEFTKSYLRSDGSYVAISSAQALHYWDKDMKEWKDIDNTLVAEQDASGATKYVNSGNNFKVSLPESFDGTKEISVSQDGYTVSFKLKGALESDARKTQQQKAEVSVEQKRRMEPEDIIGLETRTGIISYNNLYEDSTVEYAIMPKALKESIILGKKPIRQLTYSYEISAQDLTAILNEDNSISFYPIKNELKKPVDSTSDSSAAVSSDIETESAASTRVPSDQMASSEILQASTLESSIAADSQALSGTGSTSVSSEVAGSAAEPVEERTGIEVKAGEGFESVKPDSSPVFTMPAPFMFDAKQNYSNEIELGLIKTDEGYTLTYTPDNEWLVNEEIAYPVIIDPTIKSAQTSMNIYDTYVQSNNASNFGASVDLKLGFHYNYTGLYNKSYIKFAYMPTIPASSVITKTTLNMTQKVSANSSFRSAIHNITSTWSETGLNSTNVPAYDSNILDWRAHGNLTEDTNVDWDITGLVKDWYTGTIANNGVMLSVHSIDSATTSYCTFYSSDSTDLDKAPYLLVEYTDQNGSSGNSSSKEINVGRAGNISINDYTGNLTLVREDIGYSGNVMPVNISMIYNTAGKDTTVIGLYASSSDFGIGFRSNYSQKLVFNSVSSPKRFEYTNEEGRIIYFEQAITAFDSNTKTDEIYVDSSGGGYKLDVNLNITVDGENTTYSEYDYTNNNYDKFWIDGPGEEKYYFDSLSRLKKIVGKMPQTTSVTHTSNLSPVTNEPGVIRIDYTTTGAHANTNQIDKIVDGAGRTYKFNYDESYRLVRIEYLSTGTTPIKSVQYTYFTNGTLESVKYPDYTTANNRRVWYTWGSTDKTLSTAKNTDGYYFSFTYTTGSFPRVSTISEYDTASTIAQNVSVYYGRNQTRYTDNNTTKSEIIQFDNLGNAISVQDEKGFAVFGKYSGNSASSKARNKLVFLSNLQKTSVNLLSNGIANTTTDFIAYNANATRTTEEKYFGVNSFKVSGTSYHYQTANLEASKTYTLSAYVKTTGITGTGANLEITGTNITVINSSEILTGTNDWTRIYTTFETGSAITATAYLKSTSTAGSAYFDGIQLENGSSMGGYNLVENGGFEKYTNVSGIYTPNSWSYGTNTPNTTSNITVTASSSPAGQNFMKLAGNPINQVNISQTVAISGSKDDSFSFGGWAVSFAVPVKDTRTFNIQATVIRTNPQDAPEDKTYTCSFNPSIINNWQYAMEGFATEYDYSSIIVTISYDYQSNISNFDGIQLYKVPFGTNYNYDVNGNLIDTQPVTPIPTPTSPPTSTPSPTPSVSPAATPTPTPTPTPEPEPKDNPTTDKSKTNLDSYGRVIESISAEGVGSTSNYDRYNNVLVSRITNGRVSIYTENKYSANGNYLDESYDTYGNKTDYCFNEDLGTLAEISDAKGSVTSYEYTDTGLLDAVSKAVSGVSMATSYTYDSGDRLQTILANQFSYNFGYDTLGVLKTIGAGSQNLITYNYNSQADGYTLDYAAYGNGQTVNYSYSDNNTLSTVNYSNFDRYRYFFDEQGSVISIVDNQSKIKTDYSTDSDGNAVTTSNGISGREYFHKYFTKPGVNTTNSITSENNTRSFYEYFGTNPIITNLVTDRDGRNSGAYWDFGSATVRDEVQYDDLSRKTSENLFKQSGTTTTPLLTETRSYIDLPEYKTSDRVFALNFCNNNGLSKTLTYGYDVLGNITRDTDRTYVYDEAGQLIRVNDPANGTRIYAYNFGGNITSVTEYAYTTGALGSVVSTVGYGYIDAWKDKLTSFNGQDIDYDDIGNPTSYYNGYTFSWQMGRQLAGVTGNNKTISYLYNENGMRTSKTLGNVTTQFTLVDDKITQQTDGADTMYFRYDAENKLLGFELKNSSFPDGEDYYYLRNLQNDIIGILDNDGVLVVEYSYDAWGKILTTTGTLATTLGLLNPFRYRGYYYDTETGLYYLQSRYYDPNTGRFINADDTSVLLMTQGDLLGANLFAYCHNNPVMYIDPTGHFAFALPLIGVGLLIVAIIGVYLIYYKMTMPQYKFTGFDFKKWLTSKIPIASLISLSVYISLIQMAKSQKSPNLPAFKKLTIDMNHIMSGHSPGGGRNPNGNKTIFWGMSSEAIRRAIQEAYGVCKRLQTQGDNVLVIGFSKTYNIIIEMWVNIKDLIIQTAYPK